MAVIVAFVDPAGMQNDAAPAIGSCRVSEEITVPGSTTATRQDGEVVLIVSTEASAVRCAHGKTPDADATSATVNTSAGYGVPTGQIVPVVPATGDKLNFKAI